MHDPGSDPDRGIFAKIQIRIFPASTLDQASNSLLAFAVQWNRTASELFINKIPSRGSQRDVVCLG
jgi:hypothetical protein